MQGYLQEKWNSTAIGDKLVYMKLLRLFVLGILEKTSFLPSLYISCQREGLEISDPYEQWGDSVYEDNSSPLPANDKITWLIK